MRCQREYNVVHSLALPCDYVLLCDYDLVKAAKLEALWYDHLPLSTIFYTAFLYQLQLPCMKLGNAETLPIYIYI